MDNRALLAGIGLGAALAFILDPDRGSRRRALARDKAIRGARLTRDGVDATMRDMRNRATGIMAATRGRFSHDYIDNDTVLERVRAKLGRVTSHPHAIDVFVSDGEVTLCGPILAHEMPRVLSTIGGVRGVTSVRNELEPHESSAGIPALQGEGRIAGSNLDVLQGHWAPATRALVGLSALCAAGTAIAYSRR